MKKLVVLAASILLCTLAQAQGADDSGTSAGITIIPRIDLNPVFYSGVYDEVTLGNSSLYSLFEGNISENLSFSVCNHWLNPETKYLYKNTWRADDVNWCDWAFLEYAAGNFLITAGKQVMTIGGFEFEEYDYDVHPDMMTGIWNNFQCYQWGGKVGWMDDEETTGIFLQATASPYGEKPFDKMAYSMQFQGNYGPLSLLYSTNLIQNWDDDYEWMFTLGHSLEVEDWTINLDLSNKVGNYYNILLNGVTAFATAKYGLSDKWEFLGRIGYEKSTDKVLPYDHWTVGAAAHWFPLRNNKNLRVHAAFAHNTGYDMTSLTIGAMYYLRLPRNK